MRADWTKRDDNITQFLRMNGAVGVPVYFIWKDGQLHNLGETVSLSKIEKYFL
jgi:thiol:disulfide interchange protein